MLIILLITEMLTMDLKTATSSSLSNSELDTDSKTILTESLFSYRANRCSRCNFKDLAFLWAA